MQKVHGIEVVERQISGYYIAHEISRTHRYLEIAIPEEEWQAFHTMPASQVAQFLIELAGLMRLSKYKNIQEALTQLRQIYHEKGKKLSM